MFTFKIIDATAQLPDTIQMELDKWGADGYRIVATFERADRVYLVMQKERPR